MAEPTYIFQDGNVFTMVDGTVVASVKESDFDPTTAPGGPIPGEVEMPEAPEDLQGIPCPACGQHTEPQDQFCPNCGTELQGEGGGPQFGDPMAEGANVPTPMAGQTIAQTVTTPNGLKGRVLARVPALWGEEVTVRFENGVIKKIPVDQRLTFAAAEEAPEGETSVERLDKRLNASFESDRNSLVGRGRVLKAIKAEAAAHVASATDAEAVELSRVASQASYELSEVTSALDAIFSGEVEAFEAPALIENMPMVTQSSTGGSKADWLDMVHNDMVAEANALDYQKIMDEGPEAIVASLSDEQLADAGTARLIASRHINAQLAGADETKLEGFEKVYLGRVEEQRKTRLASRKEEIHKEAAAPDVDGPDEGLFL